MGWRKAVSTLERPFTKNEIVLSTEDLPGVPARTRGKVKLVNGFTWRRYWVFFENGAKIGSLDEDQLVRPADWKFYQTAKIERAAAAEAAAAAAASPTASTADAQGSAADGGDDDSPAARLRALVPPHLLERSAAARARLES